MRNIIYLFIPFMLFFGCGSNDHGQEPTPPAAETFLSVNPSEFTSQISGGAQTLTVISNKSWKVSSDADWLTCSPESGSSGNSTVSVAASANYTGAARSAALTFTADTVSKKCMVSQAGEITLSISPGAITLPAEGGSQNVTVTSNMDWTISSDADWLNYSPKSDVAGNRTVSISATGNYSGAVRSAILTFTSGSITQKCAVSQDFTQMPSYVPDGYSLVWQDEFDGTSRLPDIQKWWYETGGGGWGNNELETYISGIQGTDTCALISDGTLKIIAKRVGNQILSIRMNTSESWTYGYFEARLKMPSGKGTWPAFWMMPKNYTGWPGCGEIDIMEYVGYRPDVTQASVHCQAYNGAAGNNKTGTYSVAGAERNFYTYGLLWTADEITAYVNGVKYFSYPNDHANNHDTWPFDDPFYLKLNLAWGGNWGGSQGVDESKLPATYEIDYVRVYQK